MHLRLVAGEPGQRAFLPGYDSQVYLDGVDVSRYVSNVDVHAGSEGAISASVSFFLTGLEVDLPAEIRPLIDEAEASGVLGGGPVRHRPTRDEIVNEVIERIRSEFQKAWNVATRDGAA